MKKKLIIAITISLMAALLMLGCAGYNLEGRASNLPVHIIRVGIPSFDNNSTMPTLAEIITREIYSEFVDRGKFRLSSSDSNVDAVLRGTIISYSLVPRALDKEGQATSFLVVIQADVEFRDLTQDKVIWQQKNYSFRDEYQLSEVGGNFITLEMDSIQMAAKDFAKKLVSSILSGF